MDQFAVSSSQIEIGELEIFNALREKIYSAPYHEQATANFFQEEFICEAEHSKKQLTQKLIIE